MASNRHTFDSREMSRRGKIGAYRQHALHDTKETTKGARAGRWRKLLDQVDPQRTLPEEERQRRFRAALNAEMATLNRKSQIARSRNAGKAS